LGRLILRPETASKQTRRAPICLIWLASAPQKTKASSTNKRWETTIRDRSQEPTEKPEIQPLEVIAPSILLNASMTKSKRKGERGSPWRTPRELPKYPHGEPLTKTGNRTVEMHCLIYIHHFSPKPHIRSK
jgi:hypothetical protein